MIMKHLNQHLTQVQRAQWVRLLLDTADEIGAPADPEFRFSAAQLSGMGLAPSRHHSDPELLSTQLRRCSSGDGAK